MVKVQQLFYQRMDRRDFLRYLGLLVLSIFGITSLLARLEKLGALPMARKATRGFGSGPYGGTTTQES